MTDYFGMDALIKHRVEAAAELEKQKDELTTKKLDDAEMITALIQIYPRVVDAWKVAAESLLARQNELLDTNQKLTTELEARKEEERRRVEILTRQPKPEENEAMEGIPPIDDASDITSEVQEGDSELEKHIISILKAHPNSRISKIGTLLAEKMGMKEWKATNKAERILKRLRREGKVTREDRDFRMV